MKTIATLLVLTLVSCSSATVAPPDPVHRDIDAFVAKTLQTLPEIASIGIAVVHDGKRYARAYGYSDLAAKTPADAQTGYYIGSTTKAFTGLSAAILAERGVLDLDAPIAKYLPEVRFAPPIDGNRVTLRRLMSHTMPIENNAITFRTAFSGEHDPALLVRLLDSSTPRDETFDYDNMGYVVAGMVMQRVTGKPWQQLHDELIFQPLGMSRSTAYMSRAQKLAFPYELTRRGEFELLMFRKNDQMMHAAGGTVMTPEDLARWLEANVREGKVGAKQVLPASAIREAHKQQATVTNEKRGGFTASGYGFGWYQAKYDGIDTLYHGGGFEGWRTFFSFMPEQDRAVGVMTNSGSSNAVTYLVSEYIYDRLRNRPDLETTYAARLTQLRADVDKLKTGIVATVKSRADRKWTLTRDRASYAGRYSNPMFGTLVLEQRGDQLVASLGHLSSVVEPFTEPETARVELIPMTGEVLRFPDTNTIVWRDARFTRVP